MQRPPCGERAIMVAKPDVESSLTPTFVGTGNRARIRSVLPDKGEARCGFADNASKEVLGLSQKINALQKSAGRNDALRQKGNFNSRMSDITAGAQPTSLPAWLPDRRGLPREHIQLKRRSYRPNRHRLNRCAVGARGIRWNTNASISITMLRATPAALWP